MTRRVVYKGSQQACEGQGRDKGARRAVRAAAGALAASGARFEACLSSLSVDCLRRTGVVLHAHCPVPACAHHFHLQEFSADMNSRAVKRVEDVIRLRAAQFSEDKGAPV